MYEDDAYRTSSQFRYWSYTKVQLAALRHKTNELASERVCAAIRRARARASNESGAQNGVEGDHQHVKEVNIETLTVEEELKIVRWGCTKIIEMGAAMEPPVPMEIRATAIQYLRRFYLSNSPMTYHPKQTMMCALFLATKSDHWHISLSKFVSKLPNTTEDDVKAPEFLLMQGLRFTLDVRHPMRGLEGGIGEMLAMIEEGALILKEKDKLSAQRRVEGAADRTKEILRGAGQMTDAYFLYTPSQIWLGALQVVDLDLVLSYVGKKLEYIGTAGSAMKGRLLDTLSSCAELLKAYRSPDDQIEAREMKRIGKKLHLCQNPEKTDIVAVTRAKAAEKREGAGSDGEKALKKRKLEREKLEKSGDVFGPDLKGKSSPAK